METPVTFTSNILKGSGCDPSDKFSIILHGWIQSCGDDWALALIDRKFFFRLFNYNAYYENKLKIIGSMFPTFFKFSFLNMCNVFKRYPKVKKNFIFQGLVITVKAV